jgi:uncharacterized protein YegL
MGSKMPGHPHDSPDLEEDFGEHLIDAKILDNPELRCPCVLLLDVSGSMAGDKLRELCRGIEAFREDVYRHPLARLRVEVAIITFGEEVKVTQDFVTVDEFTPPALSAGGLTPMGGAILRALDLLDVRKSKYKANGILYHRPWLFLISDGAPAGEPPHVLPEATRRLREAQQSKKVTCFAVGVEEADMNQLQELSVGRPPLRLRKLSFIEMFQWLSNSMNRVSASRLEDDVQLAPPGWGTV